MVLPLLPLVVLTTLLAEACACKYNAYELNTLRRDEGLGGLVGEAPQTNNKEGMIDMESNISNGHSNFNYYRYCYYLLTASSLKTTTN